MGITLSFTLMLSLTPSYAFHENLGIDDNNASQLYQTKPNDPAIVRWKNALQSAISDMDKEKCFDIAYAITCQSLIATIISNCKSHPNTLLGCNDSRLPQYPLILQQALQKAEEEQKRAEEEQKKAAKAREEEMKKTRPIQIQAYGADKLDKCFINSLNASSKFEVAGLACELEMRSLQNDCRIANNTYNYCKDERFVGYLKEHNMLNSTVSP